VLLLSRNDAYQYLNKFIVAEITTTIRAIPVEVGLGRNEGLPGPCVANLDSVRTVARQWLDARTGTLSRARHIEVKRALGYALDWDELIDLDSTPTAAQ
jgi:mRNA-degrading endonuclease toxin of MazEF toxin-antitoxin module